MAAVKEVNNIVVYGDDLPITPYQIKRIMKNCAFKEDIKDEYVQWVTGDINRTSLKSITQSQAIQIIKRQEGIEDLPSENWAIFDKNNQQHRYILSVCIQKGWSVKSEKYGEIADQKRLSDWLKSEKSPVRKPLKKMQPIELSKIISALENMNVKHWKNGRK